MVRWRGCHCNGQDPYRCRVCDRKSIKRLDTGSLFRLASYHMRKVDKDFQLKYQPSFSSFRSSCPLYWATWSMEKYLRYAFNKKNRLFIQYPQKSRVALIIIEIRICSLAEFSSAQITGVYIAGSAVLVAAKNFLR